MTARNRGDRLDEFLSRLEGAKETKPGQWSARCPAHEDRRASLSLSLKSDGRVLLYCHAGCGTMQVCQALGLRLSALFPPREEKREIVAEYDYLDAAGELLFQVVRFEPKGFRQRRPDGQGGWVWKLGTVPRVLYRLPELVRADPAAWVFVVEGEKDADALAGLGLVATTNPGGAGKWNLLNDDAALEGRRVAILPDADDTGRRHAGEVAAILTGRAAAVRIVTLPGDGKDVSDWLAAGGTAAALLELAEACEDGAGGPILTGPVPSASDEGGHTALGRRDRATGRLVLSPKRTLPTAEAFVREFYTHPDGRTLHSYAEQVSADSLKH